MLRATRMARDSKDRRAQNATAGRMKLPLVLVLCVACTATTPRAVTTPSSTPTRVVRASFSAERVLATIRELAALGPREAAGPTYKRAASLMGTWFTALGYSVRNLAVRVSSGTVDKIAVRGGETLDVIAEPPGFNPTRPFVVVGGHLDTVPDAPGANDNASGVACVLELARLARIEPPPTQTVFVAFGAEESRHHGRNSPRFAIGSAAYLRSLPAGAKVRVGIILDMVGAGRIVNLIGTGAPRATAFAEARALGIPAVINPDRLLSDHVSFLNAGIPAVWLWAGDDPSFHSPRDVYSVVQRAEVERIGRVAWETLRALHL